MTDLDLELEALDQVVRKLGLRTPTLEQARVAAYPPYVEVEGTEHAAPLLVVAGAGSGKTETLALRATFMAAHFGVAPDAIMGLTFTRKAAGELDQRLRDRFEALAQLSDANGDASGGHASALLSTSAESMTYNAFALRVVQEFGARIGIDPQVVHMGEAAAWELMQEVVALWEGSLSGSRSESSIVDAALSLREDLANQALSVADARTRLNGLLKQFKDAFEEAAVRPRSSYVVFHRVGEAAVRARLEILDIIEEFDAQMHARGRMDYAQQILAAIRVVEEVPEARETLRQRHRVVFLDEFQDTSVAQLRFLSSLFADHPVTAVGDPNQAIYGWRGASAASLSDFHGMFNAVPGVPKTERTLKTAWRNDRIILNVANSVARPLAEPPSWEPHTPGVPGEGSHSEVSLPELTARPHAAPGAVRVRYRATEANALEEMVEFIRSARAKVEDTLGRPATAAVLARRGEPLGRAVAALREAGLPAQLAAGDALLLAPAIMDLRAALALSVDVGRSTQLLRLLTNLHLGALDLRALGDAAKALSRNRAQGTDQTTVLLEAVETVLEGKEVRHLSNPARDRVAALGEQLARIRQSDGSVVERVEAARWVLGLDAQALANPKAPGTPELLDQFTSLAVEYENTSESPSLTGFLGWVDSMEERERGLRVPPVELDPDAVQAMTIHSAKGLEWDIVAVIDMEDGRFPKSHRRGPKPQDGPHQPNAPEHSAPQSGWWTDVGAMPFPLRRDHKYLPPANAFEMDRTGTALKSEFTEDMGEYLQREERKLAYVAITRARSHLFLGGSWSVGGTTLRWPSIFLEQASETQGVDTAQVCSPVGEEWKAITEDKETKTFPPRPSRLEREGEQAAVKVREARDALLKELASGATREVLLAGLPDQGLVRSVKALLQEQETQSQRVPARELPKRELLAALGRTRPLQVTEIARLESQPEDAASDLVRPIPRPPGTASLIGSVFHSWIETQLRTLSASVGEDAEGEDPAGTLAALSRSDRDYLADLQRAFANSEFGTEFTVRSLETPFTAVHDGVPMRGRIDAIMTDTKGRAWLIDWKTRRNLRKALSVSDLKYFQSQLRLYLEAWQGREPSGHPGGDASPIAAIVLVAPQGVRAMTLEDIDALLAAQDAWESDDPHSPSQPASIGASTDPVIRAET